MIFLDFLDFCKLKKHGYAKKYVFFMTKIVYVLIFFLKKYRFLKFRKI
jgi:hypothetical protein